MVSAMNEMNVEQCKIGVVGAGSWGTALAQLLAHKGYPLDLWVFEDEVVEQIRTYGENRIYLPGTSLSKNIAPSRDLQEVVAGKDLVLMVVPSHFMRAVSSQLSSFIAPDTIVVTASKGIENETLATMHQVFKETLPHIRPGLLTILSGPSFAKEVAAMVPTAVTVASSDIDTANKVQQVFSTKAFRVYTSTDVVGLELGGAVKNVIALAAGISDGLGLGLNTRAALITRGLAEMQRLGVKMGADPRTFNGLGGMGDLVLTCTGELSRNHTVGKKIGQGQKMGAILADMRMVAEGVKTTKSIYRLAEREGVEMPICSEIYQILYNDCSPQKALHRLMTRSLKQELDE